MPLTVAVLAVFWALSGVIGLIFLTQAAQVLQNAGWPGSLAKASVALWAVVDIALAGLILWRPTAQRAAIGMLGVSALYLVMGSVITPWLWADPLGPLVKILPVMMLSALSAALLGDR